MLHPNNQRLVDELESLPALDGRYVDLKLVNNPGGVKRGHFSLVFKAFDRLANTHVAIKFFDMDPSKHDAFRLACFDREHDLLTALLGVPRCLQVVSPLSAYTFDIGSVGAPFLVAAKYFVTEWCKSDIDDFFLNQDKDKAIEKLKIYNEVILAIQALHAHGMSHRDVKVDNFRRRESAGLEGVVAIDLGTAAASSSTPLMATYPHPVGMLHYSAPETYCGLAGDRDIARLTDVYALGCMLFELFAEDDFWTAYNDMNPDFQTRLGALRMSLASHLGKTDATLAAWDVNAPHLLAGLSKLEFGRDGTSVPPAVVDIVNDLIAKMTVPDFRFRKITLETVRQRLWFAIKCLENDSVARMRAKRLAAERKARREKARRRGERALVKPLQLGEKNGSA